MKLQQAIHKHKFRLQALPLLHNMHSELYHSNLKLEGLLSAHSV